MAQTPEGRVKAALKKMFKEFDGLYYFMPVQMGFGAAGLDFHCSYMGWAFCVETKAPGGKVTPRQKLTITSILNSGAPVFVVNDDADIETVRRWLCSRVNLTG